jgi:hypothetical protein
MDKVKELESYLETNDFESALNTRPDKGYIYNNKIIMGWIQDTFTYAWNTCESHLKSQLAEYPVTIRTLELKLEFEQKDNLRLRKEVEGLEFELKAKTITLNSLSAENAKLRQRLENAGM